MEYDQDTSQPDNRERMEDCLVVNMATMKLHDENCFVRTGTVGNQRYIPTSEGDVFHYLCEVCK